MTGTKKFVTRKPSGFYVDRRTDELTCPHRNMSCCDTCADIYLNIVDADGVHYWCQTMEELEETTLLHTDYDSWQEKYGHLFEIAGN